MSHSDIVAHLYSHFREFRQLWEKCWEETQEFGAFVFLPEKGLDWEWWNLNRIRQYIQDGGLNDEEMLEPVWDFEFGEEFLVLVIEYMDGPEKQEAYFHRASKVRMN
jgi:hypothetical protein